MGLYPDDRFLFSVSPGGSSFGGRDTSSQPDEGYGSTPRSHRGSDPPDISTDSADDHLADVSANDGETLDISPLPKEVEITVPPLRPAHNVIIRNVLLLSYPGQCQWFAETDPLTRRFPRPVVGRLSACTRVPRMEGNCMGYEHYKHHWSFGCQLYLVPVSLAWLMGLTTMVHNA